MAKRVTVVISQGQSASPAKRKLEEDLVAGLLMERGVEVTVIPHLYDLAPDGTGILCLQGISGDMVVLSWLYPRAAHWILDRNGIKGRVGATLLKSGEADDDSDEEDDEKNETEADDKARVGARDVPNRTVYCLDLRAHDNPQTFIDEIRRIVGETSVKTVDLLSWIGGAPQPAQMQRYLNGNGSGSAAPEFVEPTAIPPVTEANGHALSGPAEPVRIQEEPSRRWYPVIDYSRCTNCMECIDFCLFGVYGLDAAQTILIEQPDNCRKGCPACSRVCPENAIIFPQHKSPAIAGSPDGQAGGLKIDLSKLFGAPNALEVAALERDVELVATGREAVGLTVGIPKRQSQRKDEPKDDLDSLMDQLDGLDL